MSWGRARPGQVGCMGSPQSFPVRCQSPTRDLQRMLGSRLPTCGQLGPVLQAWSSRPSSWSSARIS